MSEQEFAMRDADVPFFETEEELHDYIRGLINREHDYGTCVYAMSSAAVAAFNYVARQLGCTGFQASCADLDIVRRTRNLKGPFRLTNYEHLLYPQYCTEEHFPTIKTLMIDNSEWLAQQAQAKLDENAGRENPAHPEVVAHWQWLVDLHKRVQEAQQTTTTEETIKEENNE